MSNANLKRTRDNSVDSDADAPSNKKQKCEKEAISNTAQPAEFKSPQRVCRLTSGPVWANVCSFLNWKEHLRFAEISRLHKTAYRMMAAWDKPLQIWHSLHKTEASYVISKLARSHAENLKQVQSLDLVGYIYGVDADDDDDRSNIRDNDLEINLVGLVLPNLQNLSIRRVDFPKSRTAWSLLTRLRSLCLKECNDCEIFGFLPVLPNLESLRLEMHPSYSRYASFHSLEEELPRLSSLTLIRAEEYEGQRMSDDTLLFYILSVLNFLPNLTELCVRSFCNPKDWFYLEDEQCKLAKDNLNAMLSRSQCKSIVLQCSAPHEEQATPYARQNWIEQSKEFLQAVLTDVPNKHKVHFSYSLQHACACLAKTECDRTVCKCMCEFCAPYACTDNCFELGICDKFACECECKFCLGSI
jgi:hypothetical protein